MSKPTNLSEWPNKMATAQILTLSTKSVDRMVTRRRLTKRMRERTGTNGTTEAVYDPRDVERLRLELIEERRAALSKVSPAIVPEQSTALSVRRPTGLQRNVELPWSQPGLVGQETSPVMQELLSAALTLMPRHWALFLSWREAADYSGLSERYLKEAVEARAIATQPWGRGVRLRRADLDAL